MKALLIIICSFVLVSLNVNAQSVEKLWETDTVLSVPESVLFADTVLYVSNVNGKPLEKNGEGFISKVSLSGEVLIKEWATGLNAPKGMGAHGGFIYVSDIDKVAVVDIKTGEIVNTFEFNEAKFLNDIAVDATGKVYISDMRTNTIYVIHEEFSKVLIENKKLDGVNGLYWDNDCLLAGTQNGIFKISTGGKILSHYIKNTGGIDGLERVNKEYLVNTDWVGKVQLISPNNEPFQLLNFESQDINAADIGFNKAKRIIYIPTFAANTIVAYKLNLE